MNRLGLLRLELRDLLKGLFRVFTVMVCLGQVAKAAPTQYGDFDEDGRATVADLTRLVSHLRGEILLPIDLELFGDLNQDGRISSTDVELLISAILETSELPDVGATFLLETSPGNGENGVAITRETVIRFTDALDADQSLDDTVVSARFGEEPLGARLHLSADRKSITLFYADPLPANARIQVTIDGDRLMDARGVAVDVDLDQTPGGSYSFVFDTLSLSEIEGTAVCGRVFASELRVGPEGRMSVNEPLEGVVITVDGREDTLRSVTDEFGNFRLDPAPAGRFFVHIDGRQATAEIPEGAYYPFVGKAWESIPGEETNIGEVFLPLVSSDALQEVSSTEDVVVLAPQSVINEFPEFANVSIEVPAGALINEDGSPGGRVGIAPVPRDRLPGALPETLNPALVITIQSDGATNFDEPVPVCLPNLADPETGRALEPGAQTALWGFDHDLGEFVVTAPMTVSEDGSRICTDPGFGALAPGWFTAATSTRGSGGDIAKGEGEQNKKEEPGAEEDPCNDPTKNCGADSMEYGKRAKKERTANTDPVYLHSGEFYLNEVDLRIPGRGKDFIWARKYRSQIGRDTPQGNHWDCSYRIRVEEAGNGDILVFDGNSRVDGYELQEDGTFAKNEFFRVLSRNPDGGFTLEYPDSGRWVFFPIDASPRSGRLNLIIDRNGNAEQIQYDDQGRVRTIIDTLDRPISVAYNADGFIESVTDFTGRSVRYEYYDGVEPGGNRGDLKAVISPMVVDTPTGNDFPEGKRTTYTYTTGFDDPRLNGNLLTIVDGRRNDPNDPTFDPDRPYVRNVYSPTTNPEDINFDRVIRQIWGDPGDITDFTYVATIPSEANGEAVMKTILNDRNGNVSASYFDIGNRMVRELEFTGRANPAEPTTDTSNRPVNRLRASDPDFFATSYEYNEDSLITRIVHPNGNIDEHIYEGDLNPNANARVRGNLRILRRLPGTHTPAGDQTVIEEFFEYDTDFGAGCCGFNFVTKHTDGRGNHTISRYDANGNITFYQDRHPDVITEYEYNAFGQIAAVINPANGAGVRRRDQFTYYGEGPQRGYLRSRIIDANNEQLTTTFEYDQVGNVVRVVDPKGADTRYVVNALNQVVSELSREVEPGGGVRYARNFIYDANDNLRRTDTENRDAHGVLLENAFFTSEMEFGILNELVRATDEVAPDAFVVTEYEYDGNRNTVLVRFGEAANGNQPDNVIRRVYDERDLLFQIVRGFGGPTPSTEQLDYDGNRNPIRSTKGLESEPRVSAIVVDGYNRPVTVIDAMGNEKRLTYDANNNLTRTLVMGELQDQVGPGDLVRLSEQVNTYDALNRRIGTSRSFFDPATQQPIDDGFSNSTTEFSPSSLVTRDVDDNGHERIFEYDTAYRPSRTSDHLGNDSRFDYDANGNLVRLVETDKSTSGADDEVFIQEYGYDGLDRRIRSVDPNGVAAIFRYDSRGNRTQSFDGLTGANGGLGNRREWEYDGLSRMIVARMFLTEDGTGAGAVQSQIITRQVWDDSSRMVRQIDDQGFETIQSYDGLGRLVREEFADGTVVLSEHDVHDNLIRLVDANGTVCSHTYDPLNRLVRKDIEPGPGVSDDTTVETFSYDGLSRMIRATDDDSVIELAYTSMGSVIRETLNGRVTQNQYDGEGNRLSVGYPGGRRVGYQFDGIDRLIAIEENGEQLAAFDYIGMNRKERIQFGNGTFSDFQYDGRRLMTQSRSFLDDSGNVQVFEQRGYQWGAMYNKILEEDQLPGGERRQYRYDSIYRLQESRSFVNEVLSEEVSYALDGLGNRLTVEAGGESALYSQDDTTPAPADGQMNQYTTVPGSSRDYDLNGNLIGVVRPGSGDSQMEYDYRNRMVSHQVVGGGAVARYAYDPLGRRIEKRITENGQERVTRFFYDGFKVCEEQDDQGVTLATFVMGDFIDEMISMRRQGEDFFYHLDQLYSVRKITDASGNVVEAFDYDVYGGPSGVSDIGNPYLFQGRRYDPESGFYYFRNRYMEPGVGRFTTRDILGIWGDLSGLGNGYTFVGNNPASKMDPWGEVENWSHDVFRRNPPGISEGVKEHARRNREAREKRIREFNESIHPDYRDMLAGGKDGRGRSYQGILDVVRNDPDAYEQVEGNNSSLSWFFGGGDGVGWIHNLSAVFASKDARTDEHIDAGKCYNIADAVYEALIKACKEGKLHNDIIDIVHRAHPVNDNRKGHGASVNGHHAVIVVLNVPGEGVKEIVLDFWETKTIDKVQTYRNVKDWMYAHYGEAGDYAAYNHSFYGNKDKMPEGAYYHVGRKALYEQLIEQRRANGCK